MRNANRPDRPRRRLSRARALVLALPATLAGVAAADPVGYDIDPSHTYPSFEADHIGISIWRGKLDRTTGHVTLDRTAGTGTVDLVLDLGSIDFGHGELNAWARGPQFFDVTTYPTATYKGTLRDFVAGAPTRVDGELSLHGATRPVSLKINSFRCIQHPMLKREVCGADAGATFRRDEFGLTAGKEYGFNMDVVLRIQVEAVAAP